MDSMRIILAMEKYSIYGYDNYYLCIPNNASNFYHLFISFSMVDLKYLDDDSLYKEIRKIGDSLNFVYNNAIYVLPIIDPAFLNEAALENDDRLYNKLLKKYIQPITAEIHLVLLLRRAYISQKIKFIKQNDIDKKIIGWFSMKLGNDYVREITFDNSVSDNTRKNDIIPSAVNTNITIDYGLDNVWLEKQEENISDDLKPAYSFGFSRLSFILMMLTISLVFGIALAYMIIK